MTFDYHLVVIGAGAAGLTVAKLVARSGKKVVLVERGRPGGDCLWTGCIPTKALVHVAARLHEARHGTQFGVLASDVRLDFAAVRRFVAGTQVQAGVRDTAEAIARDGVEFVRGAARFVDDHTIAVGDRTMTAAFIVVATGSEPIVPPVPGLSDSGFDTNAELVEWETLPESLCVLGGGPIGLEFAQAMNRMGVHVTVLEAGPRILAGEGADAAVLLEHILSGEGVEIFTGVTVTRVDRTGGSGRCVSFDHGGVERRVEAERVLVAVGRRPELNSLNLAAAGISHGPSGVAVDAHLRTSRRHIFAIGDAAGGDQFTHVAEAQGRLVASIVRGKRTSKWSSRVVPRVTYTDPEVAAVGLTEEEASANKVRGLRMWRVPLTDVDRAITMARTEGFLKVLTAPGWNRYIPGLGKLAGDEIVGASLVGPHAGDLLMPLVMAMRLRLPMGFVAWNMQAYPTLALGVRQVTGIPFDR